MTQMTHDTWHLTHHKTSLLSQRGICPPLLNCFLSCAKPSCICTFTGQNNLRQQWKQINSSDRNWNWKSLRWLPEQISWLPTNYSHKLHVALSTVAPFAVAIFSWVESQTRFDKAFFMKYVKPLYVLLPHGIGSLKFKAHDRLMQVNHQLQMSYWMNY